MYYRYKTKKKKRPFLKFVVITVVVSVIAYAAYQNRQYVLFWKYTTNKILEQIADAEKLQNPLKKRAALDSLVDIVEQYKKENPVNAEAFLMCAGVYHHLALTCNPGSFSELLVNNKLKVPNRKAFSYYIQAIKYYKKALRLEPRGNIHRENVIDYAHSLYMTGYSPVSEILKILSKPEKAKQLADVEDRRFYGVMLVLGGKTEQGLSFLKKYGGLDNSIHGTLFLAVTEKIAKNYTSAIVHFKKIVVQTKNTAMLKLVYVNLGEIYFSQSLYKESLEQFVNAQNIDEADLRLKLWMSKNYNALGYKDKAKALLHEVLAKDSNNSEARNLLQIM